MRAIAPAERTLRLGFRPDAPFIAAAKQGEILKVMREGAIFRFKLYESAAAIDAIRACYARQARAAPASSRGG
jgi:hypothetical protein